ncbi:hypothetical protein ACLIA0_12775 [Bacillaceae bacterium W0354]
MERLKSTEELLWIKNGVKDIDFDNFDKVGCKVLNLLPNTFERYIKIIHPIYRDNNIQDEKLLWSDTDPDDFVKFDVGERLTLKSLAKKYHLPYTKEISTWSIHHALGGIPRYLICPDEGTMDEMTLRQLVSVLECFCIGKACFFYYEVLKLIYSVGLESGEELFYKGKLEEVFSLYKMGDQMEIGSPTYWWCEDKSWCIYTDYDMDFSIVGGSDEIVDALLSNNELECIEVESTTRLDYKADK